VPSGHMRNACSVITLTGLKKKVSEGNFLEKELCTRTLHRTKDAAVFQLNRNQTMFLAFTIEDLGVTQL
jgi:hypothetical protein